jgi:hypothetical protein
MERTRKEPQTSQNQADCYFQTDNCGANGFAAGSPNAEVPHGLQADGIESRCKGRKIVRDEKGLDQHSGCKYEDAQNQEAYAAIEKNAVHHDERRQQGQSGIEFKVSEDLDEGLRQKPGGSMDFVECG